VSMVAGAPIPMSICVAVRSFFVGKNGFSPARFFHLGCGDQEMSLGLLAAQSSLIYLEELLSKIGPIIHFLFPAYVPLVSAFSFACSNLAPRIFSLLTSKQQRPPCLVFTLDPK
jgi:hypothetical protein